MASLFCTNCGSQIPEGSKFCSNCGTPAPVLQPAAAAPESIADKQEFPEAVNSADVYIEPEEDKQNFTAEPSQSYEAVQFNTDSIKTEAPFIPEQTYTPQPSPNISQPVQQPIQQPVQQQVQQPYPAPAARPQQAPQTPYPEQWQSQGQQQPRPPAAPVSRQPEPQTPPKNSPYALMGAWDYVGSIILMGIPVIGLIVAIIWAVGGCRKLNRRNLARGYLLLAAIGLVICIIISIIVSIVFADFITDLFEIFMPGYTIEWGF